MTFNNSEKSVNIFGVEYSHFRIDGDLFLTEFGRPWLEHLKPSNWNDPQWLRDNPDKVLELPGTGRPRRITTQPVQDHSIDIVVKWCRVGQVMSIYKSADVDFISDEEIYSAAWNGPFQEFGLLEDYRSSNRVYSKKVHTQRPLAIYSPSEQTELWRTGRDKHKFYVHNRQMRLSQESDQEPIELDIHRLYAMIYLWVPGEDLAAWARRTGRWDRAAEWTRQVYLDDVSGRGYCIPDMKPGHIIIRDSGNGPLLEDDGKPAYALIDYELLRRTAAADIIRRKSQRSKYWNLILHGDEGPPVEGQRRCVNILGVDYVTGPATNGGQLWVLGTNPRLFDYFDPMKWRRSPRKKLSLTTYRTETEDGIHLVYRESKVKTIPASEPDSRICRFGYNSPFEEVAIAFYLRKAGIEAVYPRAIYRTSHESYPSDFLEDLSRIHSHAELRIGDEPILSQAHDYYVLFGLWRGYDPLMNYRKTGHWGLTDVPQAHNIGFLTDTERNDIAEQTRERLYRAGFTIPIDEDRFVLLFEKDRLRLDELGRIDVTICIDGNRAFRRNVINKQDYNSTEQILANALKALGYHALDLRGDHILFNMNPDGILQRNKDGEFRVALCTFELIKPPWFNARYQALEEQV